MKAISFCLLLSILLGSNKCVAQEKIELKEIEIVNSQLNSLLQNLVDTIKRQNLLNEKTIILLQIEKKDSDVYIYFSLGSRSSFDYTYRTDTLNLMGFCKIGNEDVFILDYYSPIMCYLDKTRKFLFSKRIKIPKGKIPPPPPLSNSRIFRFILKTDGTLVSIAQDL